MELTQKIECTQELYANTVEREVPDQIGFLGICGVKYPLKKGPNKIGRDPNTCNIILNSNSISRQHAVINILNSYDFMLMDLDSANKTKLADKTLQAYIPTPLKNGDMVQFGQEFGVFRFFEDDNDLPMTQALDIPETPVRNQHVSKVNLITTIPESPEVSDRDDSFIVASQPKSKDVFKNPSTNFIKSSGKTITIKPVGSNKIDNVYWSSSKKSDSFNLESDISMNTSLQTSKAKETIHEQDTQVYNNNSNFIYEADTQVGDNLPPIYNIDTQLPIVVNLPEVHKVHGQENVNIDLFTENKENDNNLHNSETSLLKGTSEESKNLDRCSNKNDVSDDIILFDEIESPPVEEDFESQALLLPEFEAIEPIEPINEGSIGLPDKEKQPQHLPISNRRDSGSSTDCEDIDFALTQKVPERRTFDDNDSTDCEDAPELTHELNKHHKAAENSHIDDNLTDCENEIEDDNIEQKEILYDKDLEDLATQIIKDIPSNYHVRPTTSKKITCIEDLANQIVDEDKSCRKENSRDQLDLEELPTQILHKESQNIISEKDTPFKVPVISPLKRKRKDQTESIPNKGVIVDKNVTKDIDSEDEEKYYAATQELLNDLCTQRELSPEIISFSVASKNVSKAASDNNKSITDHKIVVEDIDEKIDQFVMNLTNSVIKDAGVEKKNAPLKKVSSSDSSDLESTPKKLRPSSFLEAKLPNTDEIKKYLKQSGYASTESSKGSDTDSSKHNKPYINKKKNRKDVKRVDLTTKFESEKLPERVITRVRKPTSKMLFTEDSKKDFSKMPQSATFESNYNKEKETVALSDTFTPNTKENLKKQTNKTDIKRNNVSQKNNKCNENNKTKENVTILENNKSKTSVRLRENNKSKERNKIQENNKSKERNKIQENDRSKESNEIPENVKSKGNHKNLEKKQKQENNKSKKAEKKNNENTSCSNEIENKLEKKSTRQSSRTKDKQHEVRREERQLKVKTAEVKPVKIETGKSNRQMNLSTHNKKSRKESNTIEKYLLSTPVEDTKTNETKTTEKRSRRSKNKETTSREESIETEVRRSKRQRTAKRSFDTVIPNSKQIKTSNHEQSAVYNISSESGIVSPNKLKRQASDFSLPMAKKIKTINSSNVVLRTTPARKNKAHVLFTAFPCDEVKVKLEKLGAVVVTDIMQCSVVLTLQIRRTFKLLCAVGLGKPIVGPNWVQACVDTNMIVDPWLYLIKDELTEKRFQFNLERVLLGNRQFLKGYNVSSTPNIMPSPPEMKLIVECSGGTWNNGGRNWICVSSNSDRSLWSSLKRKGATVVSSEFILGGVLTQTPDIQRNKLA